jgi:hypothetical protein
MDIEKREYNRIERKEYTVIGESNHIEHKGDLSM